ncbi:hypothetical protein DERP_007444 [Dermatophagoides pteronyssinus]|uniref:Uncharacterized protein n=1 Tax=Dermatophagoides pteronyssinus TaxID=6956 RepID=A0ABQ8J4P6_DERPT|nr:hypothetical protein DERP_007444 [Dermatophagoides pteronyssinus]
MNNHHSIVDNNNINGDEEECLSFFKKLRIGIGKLNDEIENLETITKEITDKVNGRLDKNLSKFQSKTIDDADQILEKVQEFHSKILNENNNPLDAFETKLLNLRERLLGFEEENHRLSSKNYQPFRPKDTSCCDIIDDETTFELTTNQSNENLNNDNDGKVEIAKLLSQKRLDLYDTPKSNNNNKNNFYDKVTSTPNTNDDFHSSTDDDDRSFNLLSTVRKQNAKMKSAKKKSTKIDLAKCDNPIAARALAIYNRWMPSSTNNDSDQSICCSETSTLKLDDDQQISSNKSLNRRMTPRNQHHLKMAKNLNNDHGRDEYETIEFTPGMTTKVRKSIEN